VVPTGLVPVRAVTAPVPEASSWPVVVRTGDATIVAAEPSEVVVAHGTDALGRLDRLGPGWWAGYLSYDLGRAVERVRPRAATNPSVPDLVLARYDARLVVDRAGAHLVGTRRARAALEQLLEKTRAPGEPARALPPPTSSLDRGAYAARVASIIDLIEAGDCYQVNLTRRLEWDAPVDPVALHAALEGVNPAPHAALLVLPGDEEPISIVSASPERFLA
jgi:para-aminobenzoate synthetase component 1